MTIAPGTTYLTAKTPGSAGNVPIAGTLLGDVGASATGMLGGLDPLSSLYLQVANLFDLAGKRAALDAVAADQVAGARGLTQVPGTLGTPAAIYDVAWLDCDTKGGFDVDFFTVSGVGGTPSAVAVRINGSDTANLIWLAQRYATSGLVLNVPTSWIAGWSAYNSGDVVCARISCETPHSNVHGVRIRVSAIHIAAGTAIYFTTLNGWYKPASPTEIVSVGLANVVGTEQFAATSSHILTRRVAP